MKTPPLLIGAAALFWGWQIDAPLAGVAVALIAEGARHLPWRIAATREQLQRIVDFCTVLAALGLAWLFATRGAASAVLGAFQWLPLALLPLAATCALAKSDALDLSLLFLFMRKRLRSGVRSPGTLHFGFAYLAVLLVGASIANREGAGFYLALLGCALWASLGAAWPRRPRLGFWIAFACAAALGYGASQGLHAFQGWLTEAVADWFIGGGLRSDPYRSRSALGTLGRLKAQGKIIGRVYVPQGERAPELPPFLLKQASYDRYVSPDWIARDAPLAQVAAALDGRTWPLAAAAEPAQSVRVVLETPEHAALLALPRHSFELRELLAEEVKANRLGALRARMEAPRIPYTVRYSSAPSKDSAPHPADLEVPANEIAALDRVLAEAKADSGSPAQRLESIARQLAANYRYTLYREAGAAADATPLSRFLLDTHAGHCEFFATATVLLARRAGIPARYATGFAVQEWSGREGAYLLRARHAHAWAEVWSNGAWTDLDTTPADWSGAEAEADGPLRSLADFWQWLAYLLGEHPGEPRELPWWLFPAALALAVLYFAARLFFSRRERLGAQRVARARGAGGDEPLRGVEARLARAGLRRNAGETLSAFAARVARSAPELAQGLDELFALRYRRRFDPQAPSELGDELARAVERWLAARRAA
jgi:transglutaminase-like putative cysteine protease